MQLPAADAHFSHRVRFGRYVARRLKRAKLAALATDVEAMTAVVLQMGRALEDANNPVQDALADRDAADDDLDGAAQTARANLAGRAADAVKQPPYTLIFPHGSSYYTAAPLDQEVTRYHELAMRLDEHLPANDTLRASAIPAVKDGIIAFQEAVSALDVARTAEALATTRLLVATEAWETQLEKTYGALVAEVGRSRADTFFPRIRSRKASAANDE